MRKNPNRMNGDLSKIAIYTNGDLRYTFLRKECRGRRFFQS